MALPFACQICLDAVRSPTVCPNGHPFCSECMQAWLAVQSVCPSCRVAITPEAPCRRVIGTPVDAAAPAARNADACGSSTDPGSDLVVCQPTPKDGDGVSNDNDADDVDGPSLRRARLEAFLASTEGKLAQLTRQLRVQRDEMAQVRADAAAAAQDWQAQRGEQLEREASLRRVVDALKRRVAEGRRKAEEETDARVLELRQKLEAAQDQVQQAQQQADQAVATSPTVLLLRQQCEQLFSQLERSRQDVAQARQQHAAAVRVAREQDGVIALLRQQGKLQEQRCAELQASLQMRGYVSAGAQAGSAACCTDSSVSPPDAKRLRLSFPSPDKTEARIAAHHGQTFLPFGPAPNQHQAAAEVDVARQRQQQQQQQQRQQADARLKRVVKRAADASIKLVEQEIRHQLEAREDETSTEIASLRCRVQLMRKQLPDVQELVQRVATLEETNKQLQRALDSSDAFVARQSEQLRRLQQQQQQPSATFVEATEDGCGGEATAEPLSQCSSDQVVLRHEPGSPLSDVALYCAVSAIPSVDPRAAVPDVADPRADEPDMAMKTSMSPMQPSLPRPTGSPGKTAEKPVLIPASGMRAPAIALPPPRHGTPPMPAQSRGKTLLRLAQESPAKSLLPDAAIGHQGVRRRLFH